MSTKGRKVGGDAHDEKPYGPSWYDVYIILAELHARFPDKNLTVSLLLNTSVKKTAGLVVWVRDDVGTVWGAQRYLDKDPSSSKTAAAAFWTAITRAFHRLEEKEGSDNPVQQGLDISESEDDIPF